MLQKFKALKLKEDPQKIVGSLSDPEIDWLMSLAAENSAQRSLETGLGNGYSAAALLVAGVAQHTSVEMSPRNLVVAQSNVAAARGKGQYFRLLMGTSDLRLAELVQRGEKFDLILIDGGHSYEDTFIDIHYARSLLDAGGILVVDDVNWPSVAMAVNQHANAVGGAWARIEAPEQFTAHAGFNMATFKRTASFIVPPPIPPQKAVRPQTAGASPAAPR